ncbi:MAG TPA: hypothetical protein VGK73_35315, partial [Polyangiaceae bacterium]
SGTSPALVALLGVAALIVIGVVAFVAGGGARAFRERDNSGEAGVAARSVPPLPAPPAVQPNPAGEQQAGLPDASARPLPSAAASVKAGAHRPRSE